MSGKDANLTTSTCFGNISSDVAALMNQSMRHDLNVIYKIWQGLIPLPIAVVGLILTITYIMATLRAIKQHRVSRKCYVLLINRAVGDLLACVMAISMGIYANSVEVVAREVMQTMDLVYFCCFYSAMVSYVSLSLIKLYAVSSPLEYRRKVTMRRCIYLIVLSWIVCAFMVGYALSVVALTRIPALNRWSGCRVETCMRTMYRVRNSAVILEYTVTIGCFLVIVVLLRRARRFVRSFHQKSSNAGGVEKRLSLRERFPLWYETNNECINICYIQWTKYKVRRKNVGRKSRGANVDYPFNRLYAIWAVVLMTRTDKCFFLRNFNTMMMLLGFVRISLLLRILVDPIVAFVSDIQIRRSMLAMFGLTKKVTPMDSRKRRFFFGRSDPSEENSSETDLKNLNRQSSRVRPSTVSTNLPSTSN